MWNDVEPDPFLPPAPFVKLSSVFQKIGDRFVGVYEGDTVGMYGQNFTFNTAAGRLVLTFKGQALKHIQKCGLQNGNLFAMQLKEKKDVGKDNPMPIYLMRVDKSFAGTPLPKNGANVVIPVRDEPASEPDYGDPFTTRNSS